MSDGFAVYIDDEEFTHHLPELIRFLQSAQAVENNWTHLCFTYDGETIALYVNGLKCSTRENCSVPLYERRMYHPLSLGTLIGEDATSFYNGLIADVRLYSESLSEEEVFAVYENVFGADTAVSETIKNTEPVELTASVATSASKAVSIVPEPESGGAVKEAMAILRKRNRVLSSSPLLKVFTPME